jgi:hypothetical protein
LAGCTAPFADGRMEASTRHGSVAVRRPPAAPQGTTLARPRAHSTPNPRNSSDNGTTRLVRRAGAVSGADISGTSRWPCWSDRRTLGSRCASGHSSRKSRSCPGHRGLRSGRRRAGLPCAGPSGRPAMTRAGTRRGSLGRPGPLRGGCAADGRPLRRSARRGHACRRCRTRPGGCPDQWRGTRRGRGRGWAASGRRRSMSDHVGRLVRVR